jgi:hypothetical protein
MLALVSDTRGGGVQHEDIINDSADQRPTFLRMKTIATSHPLKFGGSLTKNSAICLVS